MEAPPVRPCPFRQLPSAVLLHAFTFLSPNERALTARFTCRHATEGLTGPQHCTASLSKPQPHHAVLWAVEAGRQHVRQLPFRHKLQLLSTAAASGSEVNLEVALAVLQPSIFPEMLVTGHDVWSNSDILPYPGPGEAAIAAGHLHLLGWLLRHCPALVCPTLTLEAAAEHCDLAGLQGVWRVLNGEEQRVDWGGRPRPALNQWTLNAAARSLTPDAVAKMEWVLGAAGEGSCSLGINTLESAVRFGDLDRLRWLQERGCSLNDPGGLVLGAALQYADMSVVRWLVDEAGCDLLGPQLVYIHYWDRLVAAAARGPDGLARVLWLRERGVVLNEGMGELLEEACVPGPNVTVGQVHTLRYIMQRHSDDLITEQLDLLRCGLCCAALASGSIALVEELRQSGVVLGHQAYHFAGRARTLEMIRWLAAEAKVPSNQVQLAQLIESTLLCRTPAKSQGLREAVQLLVGAGAGACSRDVQQATVCAATYGNLPLVQSLAQHEEQQVRRHPDWHRVMDAAAEGGYEALLEWLAGKAGCLANAGVSCMPAVRKGDRGTLTALRRLGVPWGAGLTVAQAVQEGCQVPVLRWLVQQGAPLGGKRDIDRALAVGEREGKLGAEEAAWLRGLAEAAKAAAAAARRGKGSAKAGHDAAAKEPAKPPRGSPRNHGR